MSTADTHDRVETLHDQYQAMLDALQLRPPTRRWVGSLFGRGLRLADEIEARFGPLRGKRVLELGSAYAGDLLGLHARGADCVATDRFDFRYADFHRRMPALGARTADGLSGRRCTPADNACATGCPSAGACGESRDAPRFHIVRCDAFRSWPFRAASFDVVLGMDLVEMVEDLDGFFAEIARVLRPGGCALLATGLPLKSLRCDPIYGLPLTAVLPNQLRRFVAEQICGHGTDFRLSNHNFNSAGKFVRHARPAGLEVLPAKYQDSPLMASLAEWPLGGWAQSLVRWYAFDFVFVRPTARTGKAAARR